MKKNETMIQKNIYRNVDFISGSFVIAERLFSAAKILEAKHGKFSSPTLIEGLLFLKVNPEY